jgi:hypothetical protein
MIYLDSETCGLHGMPVILQWAKDNGPIQIHEFWRCPIIDTINLLEEIAKDCVCGFNLSYDWFHLIQDLHNLLFVSGLVDNILMSM